MFVVACFYLPFVMIQLLLSRLELTKHISNILIYSCDHIICPDLLILFYTPQLVRAEFFKSLLLATSTDKIFEKNSSLHVK